MQAAPSVITAASVVVRDDVPSEVCDAYVQRHRTASAYHRPLWLDIFRRAFAHEARYLAADSVDGLCGVLPLVFFRSRIFGRFAVSLPFVNYGGMLADSPQTEDLLLQRAIEEARAMNATHLELRHTRQHFPALTARRHKVAMELALAPSVEGQWAGLDRKLRNQVRKAEKSGLETRSGGAELLDDFYAVFCRNMRDLGTPVYGRRFFAEILSALGEQARVFSIRVNDRPVAASITHTHRTTMEVPWASAVREFNPLCANVLLYWEMVRFAAQHQLRTFDFGRSTRDAGTYHFKRQWGAVPRELIWEYWTRAGARAPDLSPGNARFSLAIRGWQKLPVRFASALGPHIVRNIP